MVDVVGQYVVNGSGGRPLRGAGRRSSEAGRGEQERGKGCGVREECLVSCPVISCHINIFDLLIIGEYHAAEVGTSLQYEF